MSAKDSRSSSPGSRGSAGRAGVKTPPSGNRRPAASRSSARPTGKSSGKSAPKGRGESQMAQVVRGREVEFWGISAGLLLILSMYAHMAGPLGTGIDKMFGWLFGLGRFALPVVAIVIGVAMVRRRSVEHRVRLSVGWGIEVLTILGLLHIVNGEDKIVASVDAMSQAGGWFGAIIGEPLRTTVSSVGAFVVLLAAGVVGAMLITDTTLPELIELIRSRAESLNAAREEAQRNREERVETRRRQPGMYDLDEQPHAPAPTATPKRPKLYDMADEFETPAEKKPRTKPAPVPADPEFHQKPGMAHRHDEVAISTSAPAKPGQWSLPSVKILGLTEVHEVNMARVAERGHLLVEALASHGVDTRLLDKTVGPTVTRFELELGAGVKVAKVTSLNRDIAYSMAATDVRILAPIPGKSAIGVEVPNESRQLVSLGDLMVSPEAKSATHPLDVAVGMDIAGRAVFMNLASTPHMLIAGATGAGKSSGINSILTSLLMRSTPDQVRLILIDPKQVEMGQYARLPHLLTAPVTNPKKAAKALGWAVKEMERRYDILAEVGARDITSYQQMIDRGEIQPPPTAREEVADALERATGLETEVERREPERLRYIVVVVDELNDLMMVAARDVEESVVRIAQMARAVGIHLIVATQRPSVDVITGVIKANIPARMAFQVAQKVDSRTILDAMGADKLLGKGDMLYLPPGSAKLTRAQGVLITDEEINQCVEFIAKQGKPSYEMEIHNALQKAPSSVAQPFDAEEGEGEDEELIEQCLEVIRSEQKASL